MLRTFAHRASPLSTRFIRNTSFSTHNEGCTGSPTHGNYAGNGKLPYVSNLEVVAPEQHKTWPIYRVMDENGVVREGATDPEVGEELCVRMYNAMVQLQTMDNFFYDAQRQGRISFYMTCWGEEAIHIGSAAGLANTDEVFAQYREAGVLLWRGFGLQQVADQCFSNADDTCKARQMPVHYGSKQHHYQTISSPLATQIPQAVGAGYALKVAKSSNIAVAYFGEGAASEGDFHAALNFASTVESPTLFFCRNNGFAISTPVKDQFRGDGIASRGPGYGMHTLRVDGNDVFAVYAAVKEARRVVAERQVPVLLEAMTYRIGHHSTSDDSTRYRAIEEIRRWQDTDCPLRRLRSYMEARGWWCEEREAAARDRERANVLKAMERAEAKPKPALPSLFDDVYHTIPAHLAEQKQAMLDHIAKYPSNYTFEQH